MLNVLPLSSSARDMVCPLLQARNCMTLRALSTVAWGMIAPLFFSSIIWWLPCSFQGLRTSRNSPAFPRLIRSSSSAPFPPPSSAVPTCLSSKVTLPFVFFSLIRFLPCFPLRLPGVPATSPFAVGSLHRPLSLSPRATPGVGFFDDGFRPSPFFFFFGR